MAETEPHPRLSDLLEQRQPSFEESRDRADKFGLGAANGYTAGYYRAVMELRALELEADSVAS